MAIVNFTVQCLALYNSELVVPDDIKDDKRKVLDYIRENLSDANVYNLRWLDDCDPNDAVTMEDIGDIIG